MLNKLGDCVVMPQGCDMSFLQWWKWERYSRIRQLEIHILYSHLAYAAVTIEVVLRILVIDKVKGKGRVPYLATEASWKECWQE